MSNWRPRRQKTAEPRATVVELFKILGWGGGNVCLGWDLEPRSPSQCGLISNDYWTWWAFKSCLVTRQKPYTRSHESVANTTNMQWHLWRENVIEWLVIANQYARKHHTSMKMIITRPDNHTCPGRLEHVTRRGLTSQKAAPSFWPLANKDVDTNRKLEGRRERVRSSCSAIHDFHTGNTKKRFANLLFWKIQLE